SPSRWTTHRTWPRDARRSSRTCTPCETARRPHVRRRRSVRRCDTVARMHLDEVAVDALATHRLVRLLQRDTLPPVARARERVIAEGPEWAADLADCPWCLGVWVAAGVVAAREVAPRQWGVIARVLAMSSVAALVSN